MTMAAHGSREEQLLDAKELQRRLGLKRTQTVYDYVARGMPCLRISTSRVRFNYRKVLRWFEKRGEKRGGK